MTEEERIFRGELFASEEPELVEKKRRAHRLSQKYNETFEDDAEVREAILRELLGELGEGLVIDHVHLGLGEHDALGLLIDSGVDLVGVIAVQNGHRGQSGHAELLPQGLAQSLGLHVEARLLLGITAVNTHFSSSTYLSFDERAPARALDITAAF